MSTHTNNRLNISLTDAVKNAPEASPHPLYWEEYSSFHDSFAEQLAYENSRRSRPDIWNLNYI